MTKITFYQDDSNNIVSFSCEGHAGYAEKGEDIVCSAISALVINAINSIMQFTDTAIEVEQDDEDAFIMVKFVSRPDTGAELLLKSLILGLQSIEDNEETEKFVDLIFEEV